MKKKIYEVFGLSPVQGNEGTARLIEVRDDTGASPYIPKKIPEYVFRKDVLSDVLAWVCFAAGQDPLYVTGNTGTGKTSAIQQIAAVLNQPLYTMSCHEGMEATELLGRWVVDNGSTRFKHSPLIEGLKDPLGAWVFLDEEDALLPGNAMVLHCIAERKSVILPDTGEILDPAKYGARLICAGNTNGSSDGTGHFSGTNLQNQAFMGRFMMVKMDYPSVDDEVRIVHAAEPRLPVDIINMMVKVANTIRGAADTNPDSGPDIIFCTRSLIRWAHLLFHYGATAELDPLYRTVDRAIGNKLRQESKVALHEIVQKVFDKKEKGGKS